MIADRPEGCEAKEAFCVWLIVSEQALIKRRTPTNACGFEVSVSGFWSGLYELN